MKTVTGFSLLSCRDLMAIEFLLVIVFTPSLAHSDVFASIGHMTDLLFTERDLVTSLKDYIRAEENKLAQIKQWADKLDLLSTAATSDPDGFLGHPVNAFKLIRRLNTEWSELEHLVLTDTADAFLSNLTIQRQHFPSDEDQSGAAKALTRLLDTYQLDTDAISTGKILGSSSAYTSQSVLTVDDCFELGRVAYSEGDYYHTELWMLQALRQMEKGETPGVVDAVMILDHLSYSVYQQGELERALDFTKKLLELDSTHQRATGNRKYFEYQLAKQNKVAQSEQGGRDENHQPNDYRSERKKYEQLCRGEGLKMLRRATVHDPQTGQLTTAPYRVSKSAWLGAFEHPVVDRINQRIEDITGLDVSTAEDLQVANYGVGGQYEPHYDFGRKDEPDAFKELGTGNRIATWLLYMSEVQAGGATVFTDIGASVSPKKGSAVFWYNLHPSGDGDYRTRHAACPVLLGNKWVSNKWIHERGQEFRRRCDLQEDV
ncbi:prolyl 4-hydroxylase subunit alpha-1-like isoform X2 [Takifugu rubripes]|uniref:prolyl 4-hydroxylase subunit alpha-1-like isoform X2 n=1 Tax=Takifugu rubripes TaxID=31033 RepID=UPI00114542D7|nr:prolyl 4-hydroxylase subunit alpha-1-like isoform X2 [Takifugu rubripes]